MGAGFHVGPTRSIRGWRSRRPNLLNQRERRGTSGGNRASHRHLVAGIAASVTVVLVAASCGRLHKAESTGPAALPSPSTAVTVSLPTLPPIWVLEPDLFDSNGCAKFPEEQGGDVCPAPEPPGTVDPKPGPDTWQSLLGFQGRYYTQTLSAGELTLLSDSVMMTSQGSWGAWGLVRNEGPLPVGADVQASLSAADGSLIETVSGHVPVDPLRPGEPGPFALTSLVPAVDVAQVSWSVVATPPGLGSSRSFDILRYWALPYGDREAQSALYSDPQGPPPYPLVVAGAVDNLTGGSTPEPDVIGAWLDEAGRVAWVAESQAGGIPFNPEQSATFPALMPPRLLGPFFLVVTDPEAGSELSDPSRHFELMLWAVGNLQS